MMETIQLLERIFFILLLKSPSNTTMINSVMSIIFETDIDKEILKANRTISIFLKLDSNNLFINH